jgi:hypothetical protein
MRFEGREYVEGTSGRGSCPSSFSYGEFCGIFTPISESFERVDNRVGTFYTLDRKD